MRERVADLLGWGRFIGMGLLSVIFGHFLIQKSLNFYFFKNFLAAKRAVVRVCERE